MSYKNDSLLTIVQRIDKVNADAKASLYETYDQLRDLTVSGTSLGGQGYGKAASWLLNMAQLIAPSSFMPIMGSSQMNIPGTSYSTPVSGGTGITPGGQSSFGLGYLGTYTSMPTGGAASVDYTSNNVASSGVGAAIGSIASPLLSGIGNMFSSLSSDYTVGGVATGGAASLSGLTGPANMSGLAEGTAAGYAGGDYVLPVAGLMSGIGGVLSSIGPFVGPFGIAASISSNLLQGYGGAVLQAYQRVRTNILNNADSVLTAKVKNIETVVKQLDTQSGIVKKMLKDQMESDSKTIQDLS